TLEVPMSADNSHPDRTAVERFLGEIRARPTPAEGLPPDAPWDGAAELARRAVRASEVGDGVREAVGRFRAQLAREAITYSVESPSQRVAQGVEWYRANFGWIFLKDERRGRLVSVPGATVNSRRHKLEIPLDDRKSIIAHVCR